MPPLEDGYRGNDDWNDLVKYYFDNYLNDDSRFIATKIKGNIDMAVVIYGRRGLNEGLWWLEQKVPALDALRPLDCLDDP